MARFLRKFDKHTSYEAFTHTKAFVKPNVSYCVLENECHFTAFRHDYSKDYLTFVAREDGATFTFNAPYDESGGGETPQVPGGEVVASINPGDSINSTKNLKKAGSTNLRSTSTYNTLSYSLDDGETWTQLSEGSYTPSIGYGEKILWKGEATVIEHNGIGYFSATKDFDVQGNAMSLLFGDNFDGETSLEGYDGAFLGLFAYVEEQPEYNDRSLGGSNIINAKNLSLPATTLSMVCYAGMFLNCNTLISAPELPATTLAVFCYGRMFSGCTSLTTAPELPATTLAESCYGSMFQGCTSLYAVQEVLPATTLANYCYGGMFYGCTSLTTAPELPATTLVEGCYDSMFYNCSNLNYIKAMFTSEPSETYLGGYGSWDDNVAESGTFIMNSDAANYWQYSLRNYTDWGLLPCWKIKDQNGNTLYECGGGPSPQDPIYG